MNIVSTLKKRLGYMLLGFAFFTGGIHGSAAPESSGIDTGDSSKLKYCAATGDPSEKLAFTVTCEGLSKIEIGNDLVAEGSWLFCDATWRATPKSVPPDAVQWLKKDIVKTGDNAIRVRHESGPVNVDYDYIFNGEDVRIKARVENNDPERTICISEFSGLKFHFKNTPRGVMQNDVNINAFIAKGAGFHPGASCIIGGSYAQDGSFGVGLSPIYRELQKTLFYWRQDNTASYIVPGVIPPGGALTFEMNLRISRCCDWKHLLAPYRDNFTRCFGKVRYKADNRPIGQYVAISGKHQTPENPYGWCWWRFDRETDSGKGSHGGFFDFTDACIPLLKTADGQGVIIWEVRGYTPRGHQYRPDFDVIPPEVDAILPKVREKFEAAGLKLGALTRSGDMVTPSSWDKDTLVRVHSGDPSQLKMALDRFNNMIGRGFRLYYIDSFGNSFEDYKIMKYIRENIGPEILTFSEYWTDACLIYSGAYMEMKFDRKKMEYVEFWRRDHAWEISRWLIPGVQGICKPDRAELELGEMAKGGWNVSRPEAGWIAISEKSPEETYALEDQAASEKKDQRRLPSPLRNILDRHVTPMFFIGSSGSKLWADELSVLTKEYLDEKNEWKK